MDFFKKANKKTLAVLKISAIVMAVVIVLAVATSVITPSRMIFSGASGVSTMGFAVAPASYDYAQSPDSYKSYESARVALSPRNIMAPNSGGTTGNTAENFEVTDYNASIETTNSDRDCAAVLALKSKDYVIFENSSTYNHGCNHTFKVKHTNVPEILSIIKQFNPKQISENTNTIKNQVDDFTSQTEILKNKLKAIDETLKSALSAYDQITTLATKTENAEALAKIIDSKVGIIERLTQSRIDVNTQLEYLSRSKADQLDRLDYTYFNVSVYENKYVDGQNIKDSWKEAVRQFVQNVNRILQGITVGVLAFILLAVQYLIYLFILIFVAKYAWTWAKSIWNR